MNSFTTFMNRHGQIVTIDYERDVPRKELKSGYKDRHLVKRVTGYQARVGVNYDNIQSVKEGRDSGKLPEKNQGLRGGKWLIHNFIIQRGEQYYARFTSMKSNSPKVEYFLDNEPISEEDAKEMMHDSGKQRPVVFDLKLENIIEIR